MIFKRNGKLLVTSDGKLVKERPLDPYDCTTETLTITFSGIENCGDVSCGEDFPDATTFNGTYTLDALAPESCSYTLGESDPVISVTINSDAGSIQMIQGGTVQLFYMNGPDVYRGGTFNGVENSNCETNYQCFGTVGKAYIHR